MFVTFYTDYYMTKLLHHEYLNRTRPGRQKNTYLPHPLICAMHIILSTIIIIKKLLSLPTPKNNGTTKTDHPSPKWGTRSGNMQARKMNSSDTGA